MYCVEWPQILWGGKDFLASSVELPLIISDKTVVQENALLTVHGSIMTTGKNARNTRVKQHSPHHSSPEYSETTHFKNIRPLYRTLCIYLII